MAEQISRIKARLESLDELSDLVGAMRAMSASALQQAEAAMKAVRNYRSTVTAAIAATSMGGAAGDNFGQAESPLVLAITSEHGFVGNFNARVLAEAAKAAAGRARLALIGSRGAVLADEMGLDCEWSRPMVSHVRSIGDLTLRLAQNLQAERAVTLAYARYGANGRFDVVVEPVLPVRREHAAGRENRLPPILQLPRPVLIETLATEYLVAALADALTESLASESAARLATMNAAYHNLDDKLAKLKRQFNIQRQEEITEELGDLIAGAYPVA